MSFSNPQLLLDDRDPDLSVDYETDPELYAAVTS